MQHDFSHINCKLAVLDNLKFLSEVPFCCLICFFQSDSKSYPFIVSEKQRRFLYQWSTLYCGFNLTALRITLIRRLVFSMLLRQRWVQLPKNELIFYLGTSDLIELSFHDRSVKILPRLLTPNRVLRNRTSKRKRERSVNDVANSR